MHTYAHIYITKTHTYTYRHWLRSFYTLAFFVFTKHRISKRALYSIHEPNTSFNPRIEHFTQCKELNSSFNPLTEHFIQSMNRISYSIHVVKLFSFLVLFQLQRTSLIYPCIVDLFLSRHFQRIQYILSNCSE